MQNRSFPTRIGILLTAFLSLWFLSSGCEKEVEKIVEVEVEVHDTLYVYVNLVAVSDVNADPDSTAVGGTIELTAEVEAVGNVTLGTMNFNWFADKGKFIGGSEGDTVKWKAPDEAGTAKITVHATDGTYIGIGSRLIGVGMYAPSETPYYAGVDECATCHSSVDRNQYTLWAETGHAEAWASLQSSDHAASYCEGCHTVGTYGYQHAIEDTVITGDAGWDDAKIAAYQNVQCENCHGPGSDHVTSVSKADINISYDPKVCGDCHTGEHHPTYDEWESSDHNTVGFAAGNASCQGCHEGAGAAIRLSGDLSTYYNGGAVDRPSEDDVPLAPIGCATCHNPHDATNEHQLRTVADVQLITANDESPVVTKGGSGKLCMQCHHARRAAETQIEKGYAHFGAHANPQADMLNASSGYQGVAASTFTWAAPTHLLIENSCLTCHMHTHEYIPDVGAVTGHDYEPTVEACERCHGAITDFADILARDDFDGDGGVEGVEDEVHGLMDLLEKALVDSFKTVAFIDSVDDLGHYLGADTLFNTDSTQFFLPDTNWRKAGYNWVFVEEDGSHGIHNPDYAVQLLQQAYKHLTGSLPSAAVEADGFRRVTVNW